MKYKVTSHVYMEETWRNITTTFDDEIFTNFSVNEENLEYLRFLEQAGLTTSSIIALEENVWFEIPAGGVE